MKLLNLPNIITCCNVLCGCMSIYYGMHEQLGLASLCIVLGAVFDFFDGMTARALHISSPIGKELDSLADMVSFGVAPSVLAYQSFMLLIKGPALPEWGYAALYLGAMVMAAFSALRLAKFNCDERQSLSFIGLPTPANALFWIGVAQLAQLEPFQQWAQANQSLCGALWAVVLLFMSVLLISEIPMFSLKIKPGHMSWSENKVRYMFLVLAVLLIAFDCWLGSPASVFAALIPLYVVMSLLDRKVS